MYHVSTHPSACSTDIVAFPEGAPVRHSVDEIRAKYGLPAREARDDFSATRDRLQVNTFNQPAGMGGKSCNESLVTLAKPTFNQLVLAKYGLPAREARDDFSATRDRLQVNTFNQPAGMGGKSCNESFVTLAKATFNELVLAKYGLQCSHGD